MTNKRKLKICLIGKNILVQSRATDRGMLWLLAQGLSKNGHDVTIISTSSPIGKSEIFRDGIEAHYVFDGMAKMKSMSFSKAAFAKFKELHQKKCFDILHSLDDSGYEISRKKNQFHIATAYDIEATKISEIFSLLAENNGSLRSQLKTSIKVAYIFIKNYFSYDKHILDTADGVFTTTPQQRTILERYYLYPDYHTYTVPYGINLGDLTEQDESENFKMKLNLPDDAKIILAVSDFTNAMESKPLLKAFQKAVLKNANMYLILIGNGPQWKNVEYEMLKLVLGSRVIMPGEVDAKELLKYISICAVYVNLSSKSTGLEPSLIEAMAQKKLIVGSELSPIAEFIESEVDGFLVRPADEVTLSKLLSETSLNKETSTSVGENARQKVLAAFNRQKMIETLTEAYYKILDKRKIKRRDS